MTTYCVIDGQTCVDGAPQSLAELVGEKPSESGEVNGRLIYITGRERPEWMPDGQARLLDGRYLRVDNPRHRRGKKGVAAWLFHESVTARAERMRLAV